jgi:hypothetical protein
VCSSGGSNFAVNIHGGTFKWQGKGKPEQEEYLKQFHIVDLAGSFNTLLALTADGSVHECTFQVLTEIIGRSPIQSQQICQMFAVGWEIVLEITIQKDHTKFS